MPRTLLILSLVLCGCGRSNLLSPPADRADAASALDRSVADLAPPPPPDRGGADRATLPDQRPPDGWPPSTSWAVSSTGTSYCGVQGLTVDSQGSVYFSASFQGKLQLGKLTADSGTLWHGLVARLDTAGQALWVKQIRAEAPGRMDMDSADRPHLMGGFHNEVDLDKSYKAAGRNLYVARMSPQGAFTQVTTSQGGGLVTTSSMGWPVGDLDLDPNGNALITGTFREKIAFGGTTLTATGINNSELFVARLSSGGAWSWAVKGGGLLTDQGIAVAADAWGGGYVTGTFMSEATFGGHQLKGAIKIGNQPDSYLAKLDAKGKVAWAATILGSNKAAAADIDLDAKGAPLFTGAYYGTASMGSFKAGSRGVEDVYLGRTSTTGAPDLMAGVGGYSSDSAGGLTSDHNRGVWLTGGFNLTGYFGSLSKTSLGVKDVFLARYNLFTGKWDRLHRAGGAQGDHGSRVVVDRAGNVYVAGSVGGKGMFGKTTLNPGGFMGCFIWKLAKTEL